MNLTFTPYPTLYYSSLHYYFTYRIDSDHNKIVLGLIKEEVNSMEGDHNACDIKSKGLKKYYNILIIILCSLPIFYLS